MKPKSTVASRRAGLKELDRQSGDPGLTWHVEHFEKYKAMDLRDLANGVPPFGTTVFCGLQLLSLHVYLNGWDSVSRSQLSRFLTYVHLNAHLWEARDCIKADTEDLVADHAGTALMPTHWAALLFAAVGGWSEARWLARYLLKFYEAGGLREPREGDQHDGPYYHVLRLLLTVLREGQWPAVFSEELGPYRALLQNRCDPEAVKAALVPVMDLRMARNNGYPDVDAPKRLHSLDSNVIGGTTYTVLPADLWAIQALTQRLDGCAMSLEGDHPWLQASFMQPPPSSLEPWSDDLTEQLIRVGDERFPPGWLSDEV